MFTHNAQTHEGGQIPTDKCHLSDSGALKDKVESSPYCRRTVSLEVLVFSCDHLDKIVYGKAL